MTQPSINLVKASCPVCHYSLAAPFFNGDEQPLATLGWSKSVEEACSMPRHPLDYAQCPRCTHVWNRSFTYEAIPYTDNPNRMFNKGGIWQGHLKETRDLLISKLPANPTIIDIGCGEGHFVRGLADSLNGQGRFIGFDPNATSESGVGVEFHARYFDPLIDIAAFQPDLLVMRHVLEHLTDPADFVDQLAWGAAQLHKPVYFFAEVPCIDKVFSSKRLVDFFYEHPSQFTTQSFQHLLDQGGKALAIEHGYEGEVVYGLVSLKTPKSFQGNANSSHKFYLEADQSRQRIREQLNDLIASGKKVAIWGGTGKAAAFIHYFEANAGCFPLVVDSDLDKVDTFVPKTGQRIQYRDVLKSTQVDVVIIPPQWRSKDILTEMKREEISVETVLIEHGGRLIDFFMDEHPYR